MRFVGPLAVAVNNATILATPIGGGHYFTDALAGMAVAASAIVAARATTNWLLNSALRAKAAEAPDAIPAATANS